MQDIYLTTLFQEIAYLSILMQEQHVHIFRGKSVLGVSICPTIGKACSVGQEFSGLEENFFQQESMEAICRCSRQLSLSTKGGDLSPLACCLVPGNYW